jgi:hypothetical protein
MSKESSLLFSVATVAAVVFLVAAAVFYIRGLPIGDGEKLGHSATAVAAIVGFVGLVVLVVYTRETFLLRLTAEAQLETSAGPVVLFDLSTKEWKLNETLALNDLTLRNIGLGPAFNVSVARIHGRDLDLLIPGLPLIEAKKVAIVQEAKVLLKTEDQDGGVKGSKRGGRFALARVRDAIEKGELPSDPNVTVEFQSASGKRYRVMQTITRLEPHGVRTDFVRKIAQPRKGFENRSGPGAE